MAVRPGQGARRQDSWHSVLQRGIDTASEWSDVVARRLSAAANPRARLLRQRRRARRWSVIFGIASVFWVLVTALLALWSTPAWALPIPGVLAAGAAFPATLAFLRYRWLKSEPLPAERPGSGRRLPPPGSAARPPMAALAASERGLFSLLGVLDRGGLLPAHEIRDLTAAAQQSAATMAATAGEVVSLEHAVKFTPQSSAYLVPTIDAFTSQLQHGVQQYNEMAIAAAQLVSSANAGSLSSSTLSSSTLSSSTLSSSTWSSSTMTQQRYRDELVNATDRLLGWAQAFDELGQLRRA
jgi:hypothetical protein